MVNGHVRHFPLNPCGRDVVVGDVHGCFRTLAQALGAIRFDSSTDRLFGVGDLVNRGPHSGEALEWLERRFEAVALGNHDRFVLGWFKAKRGVSPPSGSEWLLDLPKREYPRWRVALGSMPLAITIETTNGPVGIVHAESPHPSWAESLRLLRTASPSVVDDALLGLAADSDVIARHRARPVEGLRALVHGHQPVSVIARVGNRWNIDTGAGLPSLNRLSLLELTSEDLPSWTFDVDESS